MTVTCKAEESLTCSCVDVGTIIDGSDCAVDIHQTYANKAEAEAALNCFVEKARKTKVILAILKVKSQKLKMAPI